MTEADHLLLKLMEECNEVAQRASKAIQFGMDEVEPEKAEDNRTRLIGEFIDLLAVWEMLESLGVVSMPAHDHFRRAITDKKQKVKRFRQYALSLCRP